MSPADAARIVGLVNGLARGDSGGEDDDFLHAVRRQELGIRVTAQDGITTVAFGSDLSLTDLCRQAARSLRRLAEERGLRRPPALSTLEILWQPIRLRAENHPRRHRGLVQDAVLAEDGRGRWHLSVQDPHRLFDVAGAALQGIRGNVESWKTTGTRLTAFALHHCPLAPSTPTARPPALAGQFYPAEAVAMRGQIEREMTRGGPGAEAAPRACRAVMLPHAGWRFCGRTIGQTLRRVRVPETAIILGPKHTPHGADWSITPDATWEFPGDRVPVATELADDLARYVPRFQRDADTHRLEHGSEVLIPFLRHARPALRVVPVVIGANAPWAELKALGRALADLCRAVTPAPLLVISSDMNHFAPESENRRLDHLALDAMATGDPHHLLDVVGHHRISMCGVHAAAAVLSALLHLDPSPARPELVDYRTSAEAAGDTSRVVGYAGVVMD